MWFLLGTVPFFALLYLILQWCLRKWWVETKNIRYFSMSHVIKNNFFFIDRCSHSIYFSLHIFYVLYFLLTCLLFCFLEQIRKSVHTSARAHRTLQDHSCFWIQRAQGKPLTFIWPVIPSALLQNPPKAMEMERFLFFDSFPLTLKQN